MIATTDLTDLGALRAQQLDDLPHDASRISGLAVIPTDVVNRLRLYLNTANVTVNGGDHAAAVANLVGAVTGFNRALGFHHIRDRAVVPVLCDCHSHLDDALETALLCDDIIGALDLDTTNGMTIAQLCDLDVPSIPLDDGEDIPEIPLG